MDKDEMHELPKGWVWTSLEESFDIILGQSPPSSTYNLNGSGLPFYQGKSEFGNFYPTPKKWCTAPKKISEKGDVLISVRAPVGPTNICSEKSCIGRGLAAIRPLSGIETFFALYLMRAFENIIAGKGTGTTFSAITGDKLKKFHVPIPPLPEQRAIVSKIEQLFSDLDNGIENFKKAQEQLKIYRQAVLKNACEGKLVPTEAELAKAEGRDYEPADVLLARILEERRENWNGKGKYKEPVAPDTNELPELPKGWVNVKVDEIIDILTDYHANGSYKTLKHHVELLDESGYAIMIRTTNLENNNFENLKYISESAYEFLGKSKLFGEEIVIGKIGNAGKVYWMPKSSQPCSLGMNLFLLKFNKNISNRFIYFHLISTKSTGQIKSKVKGVGNPTIDKNSIRSLLIALPPLAEQHRIVTEVERRLSVCDKMEETISQSLQKAESLRQSILKKAFEGKLLNEKELEEVRSAPDWEPAEKLLERIKAEKTNMKAKKKGKK